MCYYDSYTFDCGCESQPPIFSSSCDKKRGFYAGFDRHRCSHHSCGVVFISQKKVIPGKCASHRRQAQLEKKIRKIQDEIKQLKDDVAEHQDRVTDEKEGRRARERDMKGRLTGCCGHGRH